MFNQNTLFSSQQNQCLPTIRRAAHALIWAGLLSFLCLGLCLGPSQSITHASASKRSVAESLQEVSPLGLDKPIGQELSGGLSHFYKITMRPGQFLRVVVKQQGIDVAVALLTPDGKKVGEADIDHWSLGDMQKALEKFNEALPIFRAAADRSGEAVMLNNIGEVYDSLGEMQKALEKFNEALPIKRAMGERNEEAVTLNNIGMAYWKLGETQKALKRFNEALTIFHAVGNRSTEAVTLNNTGLVSVGTWLAIETSRLRVRLREARHEVEAQQQRAQTQSRQITELETQ